MEASGASCGQRLVVQKASLRCDRARRSGWAVDGTAQEDELDLRQDQVILLNTDQGTGGKPTLLPVDESRRAKRRPDTTDQGTVQENHPPAAGPKAARCLTKRPGQESDIVSTIVAEDEKEEEGRGEPAVPTHAEGTPVYRSSERYAGEP
ncbi:unnamed protein product [Phytophthora fragariaefolia]|uniref:Unnamed protein product n=1 Tax=Phytophthora fragariaefolia TaxID=1490495 RepID=A0A9W7D0G2_9STRA|nr:unnamed protein product [Phytophthora fragariaefolia]